MNKKINVLDFKEFLMEITIERDPPIGEATDLCNEQLSHLPYYFQISQDDFERGSSVTDENLTNRTTLTARASGQIAGFAELADIDGEPGQSGFGVIRFLLYRSGERKIGQSLLQRAEQHFVDRGLAGVHAGIYTYRFLRLGPESIGGKLCHVCSLYGLNGYEERGRWLFMALEQPPILTEVAIDSDIEFATRQEDGRGTLPNLRGLLMRKGREIGVCYLHSAGEVSSHYRAQTVCNVDHFVLDEKERGRGLGRFLLQRSLEEAWRIGYDRAALETNGQYFDRHLLYSSVGFQVVDNCYKFRKQLID